MRAAEHGRAYTGASPTRRSLRGWSIAAGDADADTLPDLPMLRARSRDLYRNNSIARGAIDSLQLNTVGAGLKCQVRIDSDVLGMDDDEAEEWERDTEHRFRTWAESTDCDSARSLNFGSLQQLAELSVLMSGEIFALLPMIDRGGSSSLTVNLIEADRVCNPDHRTDDDRLQAGIETDRHGAPIAYHIRTKHPGAVYGFDARWDRVRAYGTRSQRRNVLHLYRPERPGQRRGTPVLAPVIEILKQLGRYTEAELMAAVVGAMYTVFVRTDYSGESAHGIYGAGAGGSDLEYALANGGVVELDEGQSIEIANPGRPNQAYGQFEESLTMNLAGGLGIPYEVLRKRFQSSYSASRGAIIEAAKLFNVRRSLLANYFCQPVYEEWLNEQVLLGNIRAPRFLSDPLMRKAYCGTKWIGPSQGQLDPVKEVKAADMKVASGYSTRADETAALTGGDYDRNMRQRRKELRMEHPNGVPEDSAAQPPGAPEPERPPQSIKAGYHTHATLATSSNQQLYS